MINYHHDLNSHSLDGPRRILPLILDRYHPASILDVGCGLGTWLSAAVANGVADVLGLDGVPIPESELCIPANRFQVLDLTQRWTLGRTFDLAICLEVAEHLPATSARDLVECLTTHAGQVLFSAACPDQPGENHIHCQWPAYWQQLFNQFGFRCEDWVRPMIWELAGEEWWYAQNTFVAVRDPDHAGSEPRIPALVHPGMVRRILENTPRVDLAAEEAGWLRSIEEGHRSVGWYATVPFLAGLQKLKRKLHR